MGLITAWVGYALLKREVQKGYTQVTADVEELFERYLDQEPEPNTLFQIVDGQIVDAVTGEIVRSSADYRSNRGNGRDR
jgi:hypothetical protein